MSLWLDTSALVALYVPGARSERVARLVRRVGEPILFSQLHELEVVNALRLRVFRREVRRKMVDATVARLQADLHDGTLHRAAIDWPPTLTKASSSRTSTRLVWVAARWMSCRWPPPCWPGSSAS